MRLFTLLTIPRCALGVWFIVTSYFCFDFFCKHGFTLGLGLSHSTAPYGARADVLNHGLCWPAPHLYISHGQQQWRVLTIVTTARDSSPVLSVSEFSQCARVRQLLYKGVRVGAEGLTARNTYRARNTHSHAPHAGRLKSIFALALIYLRATKVPMLYTY